jgi:hypothetical protein
VFINSKQAHRQLDLAARQFVNMSGEVWLEMFLKGEIDLEDAKHAAVRVFLPVEYEKGRAES